MIGQDGSESTRNAVTLYPLINEAAALTTAEEDQAFETTGHQVEGDEISALIAEMSVEEMQAATELSSIDEDGDGLTYTQESWWCTDPKNVDSDGDGVPDGAEVQAAKDWLTNKAASYPASGKPFASWPPLLEGCVDDDLDSVPDLAERWELGLNMNLESTDRDKFDDGQELFGKTYCPGSGGYCGYALLPRNEDWGTIIAQMPSWVKMPGNHPLVAAYPAPEVDVVPSSLNVQTVTEVTTDQVITEGTTKSYSTSKTEGMSTSVANTETWNEWQETSVTSPIQNNLLENFLTGATAITKIGVEPLATTATKSIVSSAADGLLDKTFNCVGSLFTTGDNCVTNIGKAVDRIKKDYSVVVDDLQNPNLDNLTKVTSVAYCTVLTPLGCRMYMSQAHPEDTEYLINPNEEYQDPNPTGDGHIYTIDPLTSSLNVQRLFQLSYPKPSKTETEAKGSSTGGAVTETHEQYEEHTVTDGEAFSSEKSWGTATAVDAAHSADLRFSYKVRNNGREYVRELCNLAFNVYIGDDPNPAYTYFIASDLGGSGCFNNLMPGDEFTYTSHPIPLSLEQMKAIDLGGPLRVVVEDYTYGIDELFYEDAANAGVLVAIEDGPDDGDEMIDTYQLPTWGTETVLDVMARYFPHESDAEGTMTAIWTPEYREDTPAWCVEPVDYGLGTQRTLWCKHTLSTADWWNIYTSGMGDGTTGLHETPAAPGATALFRFNKDSDLDGYSDRSETRLGTDPVDPASFPQSELLAGMHSLANGGVVTATLSFLNTGLYDAYGVEAVMVVQDDSITILNNTVGGSGRVKAQQSVMAEISPHCCQERLPKTQTLLACSR